MNSFSNYIVLNDSMISNINPLVSYIFSNQNGENITCELLEKDKYFLNMDGKIWSPDICDLNIKGTLHLDNLHDLFMDGDLKLVDKDVIVGVAINVFSSNSRYNQTYKVGTFNINSNSKLDIPYNLKITKNRLTSKFNISYILYVEKSGGDIKHYANIQGMMLGELLNNEVYVEGNGSLFPIKVIDEPNYPLWTAYFGFTELEEPMSINNICLSINASNKDYQYLGSEDITDDNRHMWAEIICSFFTLLLLSIDKTSINNIRNSDFDEGTVGLFLKYIIESFNITDNEMTNPSLLRQKLKIYIEKVI